MTQIQRSFDTSVLGQTASEKRAAEFIANMNERYKSQDPMEVRRPILNLALRLDRE